MTGNRGLSLVLTALTFVPIAVLAADPESQALEARTFEPRNLDVTEATGMLREMSGIEHIVADREAGTIVVEGTPAMIQRIDSLIKTFDTEQPQGSPPLEMRVFHLERLPIRTAVTLLRSKMQATVVAYDLERQRVAMRDSAKRLDDAGKLLAEADAAAGD